MRRPIMNVPDVWRRQCHTCGYRYTPASERDRRVCPVCCSPRVRVCAVTNDGFTDGERAYLEGLAAVDHASMKRIVYSPAFRAGLMQCCREGGSPARYFREAGLGSELIGTKRIERCVNRWKRAESTAHA